MYDPNMPTTFDYRDDERRPTAAALKTCPFCDSTPDVFEDGEIQCSNKKCPVRPSAKWGGVEVWNTRSATPPDTPAVEQVAKEVVNELLNVSRFIRDPESTIIEIESKVAAIITKYFAATTSPSETAVGDANRLAFAIESAAVKAGIITGGQALSGPQLLMLCDDLANAALRSGKES